MTSPIDQWTYFIKNAENLDVIPENIDEGLKEAYLEADKHNWTQKELDEYERASIKEGDDLVAIETAEKKGEEKVKMEVLKNGVQMGLSIEMLSQLTGLTVEEIKKYVARHY